MQITASCFSVYMHKITLRKLQTDNGIAQGAVENVLVAAQISGCKGFGSGLISLRIPYLQLRFLWTSMSKTDSWVDVC